MKKKKTHQLLELSITGYIRIMIHTQDIIPNDIVNLIRSFMDKIVTFVVEYADITWITKQKRDQLINDHGKRYLGINYMRPWFQVYKQYFRRANNMFEPIVMKLDPLYSVYLSSIDHECKFLLSLAAPTSNYLDFMIQCSTDGHVLIYYELYCIETGSEFKGIKTLKPKRKVGASTKVNICAWDDYAACMKWDMHQTLTFKCFIDVIGYRHGHYNTKYFYSNNNIWSKPLQINENTEYEWIVDHEKLQHFGYKWWIRNKPMMINKIYSDSFGGNQDINKCWFMYLERVRGDKIQLRIAIFRLNEFCINPTKRIKGITFKYKLWFNFAGQIVNCNGFIEHLTTEKHGKLYPNCYNSYCGPFAKYFREKGSARKYLSIKIKIKILRFHEESRRTLPKFQSF